MKPVRRPANPCFSSGPCAKRPGWSAAALAAALVGRSHRSAAGLARLVEVVERSRAILGVPSDWRVGIVAGSDTGAIEIAMWSLLGPRGIDMLAWENFGAGWVEDVNELKLPDVRVLSAPYGRLPDLAPGRLGTRRGLRVEWHDRGGAGARRRRGSPPTGGGWRFATRPRRSSPCGSPGIGSTSSPGRGRRPWAAKPRTACWRCRRARSNGSKATRRRGRCRSCSG